MSGPPRPNPQITDDWRYKTDADFGPSLSFSSDSNVEQSSHPFVPYHPQNVDFRQYSFIPAPESIPVPPAKGKTRKTKALFPNPAQEPPKIPLSEKPVTGRNPPLSMTSELRFNIASRGRGRGKNKDEDYVPEPPKLGKGRAATQGMILDLPIISREKALAEQKAKRQRFDADEPLDDTQERLTMGLEVTEPPEPPKKKTKKDGGRASRDHHACDRCFRNKTKVFQSLLAS